jgi:hypothetical protein
MNVFEPQVQEGFEWIRPVNEGDFEFLATLSGTRLKGRWTPLPMRLISGDEGESFKESDFPWLGRHLLVLSDRAGKVVGPLVEKDAELLPASCEGRSLWLLNVCTIVDALDLEASDVELFESGRIMDIEKHVFYPDRLRGVDVFKLQNMRRGSTYLSERVVRAIEAAPLVGYGFRLVWTDERTAASRDPRSLL